MEDQDDEQWREIVSFFRKGKMGCSVEKRRAYKKLKYNFGPMSGDGYKVCMISVRLLILIFFTTGCFKKKYPLLFCSFLSFQNILKSGSVHFSTAQPLQNPKITIFLF